MDLRSFLQKVIENTPSRGLDNVDVYVHEDNDSEDPICFEITSISNCGCNDVLDITVKRIY